MPHETMDFLFLLAIVVVCSIPAWFTLKWVFGPLDRAAKNRKYPIQFSLADFLCLFVEIQLAFAGPALWSRT